MKQADGEEEKTPCSSDLNVFFLSFSLLFVMYNVHRVHIFKRP